MSLYNFRIIIQTHVCENEVQFYAHEKHHVDIQFTCCFHFVFQKFVCCILVTSTLKNPIVCYCILNLFAGAIVIAIPYVAYLVPGR